MRFSSRALEDRWLETPRLKLVNTASAALIWELWRRNRWGFALLIVLFLIAAALNLQLARLRNQAQRLEQDFPARTEGVVEANALLPNSGDGPAAANAWIAPGIEHAIVLAPGDRIKWAGHVSGAMPVLRIWHNDIELAQIKPMTGAFSIEVENGPTRTIPLQQGFELVEEIGRAHGRAHIWLEGALSWSLLSMAFSFLALCAIFGVAEPHPVRGFTGIPPRHFTLPVSTRALVLWPLGLGAGAMIFFWLSWSIFILRGLLPESSRMPYLYYAVLLPAALAWLQAIVWGLASFPKVRSWLLAAVMMILVQMAAMPVVAPAFIGQGWWRIEPFMTAALAIAGVIAWMAAKYGAGKERQGAWTGRAFFRAAATALGNGRDPAFRSVREAQYWMEWHRNGGFAFRLWLAFVFVALAADLSVHILGDPNSWDATLDGLTMINGLVAACWIVTTGLNLARDPANGRLSMSAFTATRPLSNGELLLAKLRVAVVLWGGATITAAAAYFIHWLALPGPQLAETIDLTERMLANDLFERALPATIVLAITLHVLIGILPLSLTGRVPGMPWSLLPLLMIYVIVVNGQMWVSDQRNSSDVLMWILIGLILLKMVIAAWGFRRSLRLRIVSRQFVGGIVGIWVLLVGALLWAVTELHIANTALDTLTLIPAAVLVVPIARLGLSTLALRINRHR